MSHSVKVIESNSIKVANHLRNSFNSTIYFTDSWGKLIELNKLIRKGHVGIAIEPQFKKKSCLFGLLKCKPKKYFLVF